MVLVVHVLFLNRVFAIAQVELYESLDWFIENPLIVAHDFVNLLQEADVEYDLINQVGLV